MPLLTPPALAQEEVPGWRLHASPHFALYTIDGTLGARDAARIEERLEQIYAKAIAPLNLAPTVIVYPLYPSVDRFRLDWWQFAVRAYGDVVHAWGTVYDGTIDEVSPYLVTRAVVAHAFPKAIPLLKWGLGDALGDRVMWIDSHRGVLLLLAGKGVPSLQALIPPYAFGDALPSSYPVAVSFVAFLLETYGPLRTARFVDAVTYRYYEFPQLAHRNFGLPFEQIEQAWKRRIGQDGGAGSPADVQRYLQGAQFIYQTSLASDPGRTMLQPYGPVVITETFRAITSLRAMDLSAVDAHIRTARMAAAKTAHKSQLIALSVRIAFWVLILSPIVLAMGWLTWPSVRARLGWWRRRRTTQ